MLLIALVWGPVSLLIVPVMTLLSWAYVLMILTVAMIVAFGFCELIGAEPGRVFLYATMIVVTSCAIGCLVWAVFLASDWLLERYQKCQQRERLLDWTAHDVTEHSGGRLARRVPMENVEAVAARVSPWISVELQCGGADDIRLLSWRGPEAKRVAVARSMATQLARALQVPVLLDPAEPIENA